MIYVARLEDGIVAQVVVAPDDYELADGEALIGPENAVGIGWVYEDGEFVDPEQESEQDADGDAGA